jgi:hypothetical protein
LDGVLLNCTASSTLDEQNARTTPSKTATTTIETPAIQMMRVREKIFFIEIFT